jgi:hypothetical protein
MTLIASGKRHCDARCYGAKGTDCHCVCGGENHGIGFDAALKNTKDNGDEMVSKFMAENPGRDAEIKVE